VPSLLSSQLLFSELGRVCVTVSCDWPQSRKLDGTNESAYLNFSFHALYHLRMEKVVYIGQN
jgi:hypothetical protein